MPLVSVSFHQSCPSVDCMRFIDKTSRQVLVSKECFLWSSLQRFDKSFVYATSANAYLMSTLSFVNTVWTVPLFFEITATVPLNQIEVTSETWTSIIPFSGFRSWWCNIRPSLLWLTIFSSSAVTFSLGSLSTNWKYPHSQNASWNDFCGPSGHAVPLPSRVSLSRDRSFLRPLLPSACYAG